MDAEILFCFARRTSACQRTLGRAAALFGMKVADVRVCARERSLSSELARLLRRGTVVFLVGSCPGRRPDCAEPVFRTLRVPLDRQGEPRGVLRVRGGEKTGYVVESVDQAILLLPDDPYEILKMLPAAFGRLKRKFGLPGEFPKAEHPDYGKLVAACMERQGERA
mgnify:CR=1 FL=1